MMIGKTFSSDSLEFDAAMQRYLADYNLDLEEIDPEEDIIDEDMFRDR